MRNIGGIQMSKLEIYHGSRYEVRRPDTKHSRGNGDFGAGFYCSDNNTIFCIFNYILHT